MWARKVLRITLGSGGYDAELLGGIYLLIYSTYFRLVDARFELDRVGASVRRM